MNDCLALRFAEYIDKRFEFGEKAAELRDSRKEPQIPEKAHAGCAGTSYPP